MSMVRVQLHDLAHGRTGDKGDRSNISVIAYRPEVFPFIAEQLTEARVAEAFRHRRPTAVKRYVLPKLHDNGYAVIGGTPDAFGALIRDGIERYGAIIKTAGIQAE